MKTTGTGSSSDIAIDCVLLALASHLATCSS